MEDGHHTDDRAGELVPASTPTEDALDTVAALAATFVPVLGGAISNVLSGMSQDRKMARVVEVLSGLAEDIRSLSAESEQYVKSEDFQDLLEETLTRVHRERSEEKRRVYRAFLAGSIQSPGDPYDESIRFLRALEQLQPDSIRVLRAMLQEPEPFSEWSTGSLRQTLKGRLDDMDAERIDGLLTELQDLKLVDMPSGLMTAAGAHDLRSRLTPFGQRFVRYVKT